MHYKVKFTTNQGGFYFPRVSFGSREDAEEWAETQTADSPRLEFFEVVECMDYEDLQDDKSDLKTLVLTALCLAVLAVSFVNIIGG